MPELPEVETVRRGLVPVMEGRVIARADIRRPDLRWPLPDRMAERLTGARVERLRRRSKYILADLSTGETLLIHLGMSGRMLISGGPPPSSVPSPRGGGEAPVSDAGHPPVWDAAPSPSWGGMGRGDSEVMVPGLFHHPHPAPAKHDHVVFDMADGARVTFNDARRFGMMDLMPTATADTHWLMSGIGPEPFGNDFHEDYLVAALSGRRTPVKAALLDQRIVAGLGNIYVSEVLHRAGISPKRLAGRIAAPRVAAMVPVIRDVLTEAIEAGGSSLRDYRQTDGELGYFQHRFRVYDREGDPCPTEGCGGIIRRIVQSGRSSFYCPHCQR